MYNKIKLANIEIPKVTLYIIFALYVISISISPHICLFLSIILLCTSLGEIKIIRNVIFFISLVMILITASSRQIDVNVSDDLINTYMPIYYSILTYHNITSSGLGIEIGYPFYLSILQGVSDFRDPRELLFLSIMATLIMYYIWMMFFFLPKVDKKYKGATLAVALLLLQVGILAQFLRQELATPFILISISLWLDSKNKLSILFAIIATMIHSSSLIIYIFFILFPLLSTNKKIILLCFFMLFSSLVFLSPGVVVSLFNSVGLGFIANKIAYYQQAKSLAIADSLSAGKFYVLIVAIFFLMRNLTKDIDRREKNLLVFCFWGTLCNLTLILLPNAARLFMLIPNFLFPIIIYPMMVKKFRLTLVFIIISAIISIFFPQRLFGGGAVGFELWNSYNWYGLEPFYYLYGI